MFGFNFMNAPVFGVGGKHNYSLCVEGLGKVKTYHHYSRAAANSQMYHIMGDNNLHIENVYDDKHDKTYICNNGVRFYVNRW